MNVSLLSRIQSLTGPHQMALTHAALSFTVGTAKRCLSFPTKTNSNTLGTAEFSIVGKRALCSAPMSPEVRDFTSVHPRRETTSVRRIPCVVADVKSMCDWWSTASHGIHT